MKHRVHFVLSYGATITSIMVFICTRTVLAKLPTAPPHVQRALGCLLSKDYVQDNVSELGLRMGESALIRYSIGTVPGTQPTPGEFFIAIYSADRRSGWIMIASPAGGGRFEAIQNAYRLHRLGGAWQADEGNGGLATYRAMSQFANWLVQHRRKYRVVLKAHPEFCSGPAE